MRQGLRATHANRATLTEAIQMINKKRSAASTVVSRSTHSVNGAVLDGIGDAWRRYPSEVPIPDSSSDDRKLLRQVLGLLDQEGVIRRTAHSIALTESGYQAVGLASRSDARLEAFLQGGSLAADQAWQSALMLAILRAHFELRKGGPE